MGILNVTPDSFWDGGKYEAREQAVARAREMVAQGADLIDVGGESTRPGAAPIEARDEIGRIGPVVEDLVRSLPVPISVDTRKASVAREMLSLGAHMINDVSGLSFDPAMVDVVKEFDVPVVVMHMRGLPQDMQSRTGYEDVVADVRQELIERVRFAEESGIKPQNLIIDPGIGFAKTAQQNVELVARLDEFVGIGKPILIGPSMKSFIGKTIGLEPEDRLEATIACCVVAIANGASIVRVHDVAGVSKALAMFDEIRKMKRPETQKVNG
jgi:dihydropteroate synthase